jgi:DNA-binding transcriptional LysR family regulator
VTLTELRHIVAVARERHFGRAAAKCFVSSSFTLQPLALRPQSSILNPAFGL